jgi:hypothetical protein
MTELHRVAPAFVEMAHRIVWCTVATVGADGRPRTRVLHPIWEWDGTSLTGWIATDPTSPKRTDLDAHPFASVTYWNQQQDTCTADCVATWELDAEARRAGWARFAEGPAPVGYDPKIVPRWTAPEVEAFGVLRLEPYRLRVMPGSLMLAGKGELMTWRS